jgi:hypothetical protein
MTRGEGRREPLDHASPELIRRYAADDPGLAVDAVWALEAHLDDCADCRALLGPAVETHSPGAAELLAGVQLSLGAALDAEPARAGWRPRRRSRLAARWAPPGVLPWLVMTVFVVAVAVVFDRAADGGRLPSILLLLAPVAPLLGVTAAWTQGRDPAYEMVAATPRAGLELVFRRTTAVLAVVIPTLALAGLVVDASPARWLLPCLAFTLGALALGEFVGVTRAAAGLAVLWTVGAVAPSLATAELPIVLEPATAPGWAALIAAVGAVLAVRRGAFTTLRSGR